MLSGLIPIGITIPLTMYEFNAEGIEDDTFLTLEIPVEKMTVDTLLHSMKNEEIGKLYTALLRIDEVNLLGDGLLKELWLNVKDECESR